MMLVNSSTLEPINAGTVLTTVINAAMPSNASSVLMDITMITKLINV